MRPGYVFLCMCRSSRPPTMGGPPKPEPNEATPMPRDVTRNTRLLLSVLTASLIALATIAGVPPASGGAVKGSLVVRSVTDPTSGLAGAVQGRPFSVVVQALDDLGAPLVVTRDTTVTLVEISGPGSLGGTLTGTIPKNSSQGTISGATYSLFANGVVLEVRSTGGLSLSAGRTTVNVARTAVKATATPRSALDVTDPACVVPSSAVPVCGYLKLPNGGNGTVLLSVGSCVGIVSCFAGSQTPPPGLVSAVVSLKDENGAPLYDKAHPATFVLGCDKSLCSNGGVPKFDVLVDVTDTGAFAKADPCPSKGVLGAGQTACLDTVQSKRDGAGDLFSVVLFDYDIRSSYP